MNGPLDHARGLLEKASHDVEIADLALAADRALDMVCFHAQQAAEKSLKALLAMDDVPYPFRHDLRELLDMVEPRLPEIRELAEAVKMLTPFAVAGRYHDDVYPTHEEASSRLETAQKVFTLVRQVIAEREDEEEEPLGEAEHEGQQDN